MLQKFKDHITDDFSFLKEKTLLIACSGGLDSIVLVALCHQLQLEFGIAHCNFKLREKESDEDDIFVKTLAEKLGILCFRTSFDTKKYASQHNVSIQMAARKLRYDWFKKIAFASKFDYVLTAHHADDNLETFLINLSRGTGLNGLTGIPKVNEIFIRPLLPFSRKEILDFAIENKLQWREDSSNQDKKYLRNHVRHGVVSGLKSVHPQFLQNFANTLHYLNQSKHFIEDQVAYLKKEVFDTSDTNTIKISIAKLHQYSQPEHSVYFLFRDYGFTAWHDIAQMMTAQSGKQIFSTTHRLVKDRAYLLLSPITEEISDTTYYISEEEQKAIIPPGVIQLRRVSEIKPTDLKTVYLDKEKLKYPLLVRKWKPGDYFYPFGMKGKKKLSKFFKDEKLSILAKENVWVLCSQEDIVWVINYRLDNRFKVTPQTEQLLKITIT
ncbi:tRNA lysidine(34) synthetase TilS [Aquimarina sp. U1-2]|uniref:tRNA lysidine(34) synthetase TilS n=1 Tax=Aquimarina sp. U1-2 TaxID=2823141 RepID=UPI001AEC90C1|nr:tRNA lysidine(34) synthetase TilS [Aquimarina sp. U1-2]MBP2832977.1 tRNA lysidine(34) synthetase TilS [Aquimarina sp. U1-2]